MPPFVQRSGRNELNGGGGQFPTPLQPSQPSASPLSVRFTMVMKFLTPISGLKIVRLCFPSSVPVMFMDDVVWSLVRPNQLFLNPTFSKKTVVPTIYSPMLTGLGGQVQLPMEGLGGPLVHLDTGYTDYEGQSTDPSQGSVCSQLDSR